MASNKGMSGNQLLVIGLGFCAAAMIVVVLVSSRFFSHEPPPPPPPPPPRVEQSVTGQLRFTENYYRAVVQEDAKSFGVAPMAPSRMAAPLLYANELDQPRMLAAKNGVLETDHLRIATRVAKEWVPTNEGEGMRSEHLLLSITNKSAHPIAYRVDTGLSENEKSDAMAVLPHNAIALAAGETITRSESLWRPKVALTVRRVEIVELTEIGYYYVSRLLPTQLFLDARTSRGHEPPRGKTCQFVPWREVQSDPHDQNPLGKVGWVDVIDFYARHNCDEYSFYRGYRRWTKPEALPSHEAPREAQNLTAN